MPKKIDYEILKREIFEFLKGSKKPKDAADIFAWLCDESILRGRGVAGLMPTMEIVLDIMYIKGEINKHTSFTAERLKNE